MYLNTRTHAHVAVCIAFLKFSATHHVATCRWFEDFEYATWDLAVFYFGKRDDFSCNKCVYVETGSGTKWSFLYKFGKSEIFQKKFAKQYQQVPQHTCHEVMS